MFHILCLILPPFAAVRTPPSSGTRCRQPQPTHTSDAWGALSAPVTAPAHCRGKPRPYPLELLPDLLPQVTFSGTSMGHLVPRPIPSGWKGCFPFSKRLSPCSRHHTEIGRRGQGPRSLCQLSPPLAACPLPQLQRPPAWHIPVVLVAKKLF